MTARRRMIVGLLAGAVLLAACGGSGERAKVVGFERVTTVAPDVTPEPSAGEQRHPDVVGAEATHADDGTWTIAATLSSPYDTPERYADAWRVPGPDGNQIPDDVDVVTIEGRDLVHGWGGTTFDLYLR